MPLGTVFAETVTKNDITKCDNLDKELATIATPAAAAVATHAAVAGTINEGRVA